MSIKAMSFCWEHSKQAGSKLLMLLAIADFADDEGVAYPGITRLAAKTRMTERNAKRTIHALEKTGELTVSYNDGVTTVHGVTNRYLLSTYRQSIGVQNAKKVTPRPHGVSPTTPHGVSPTTPHGVSPTTPKPSVEPSVEPSEKEKATDLVLEVPDAGARKARAQEIFDGVVQKFNGNLGSTAWTPEQLAEQVRIATEKHRGNGNGKN